MRSFPGINLMLVILLCGPLLSINKGEILKLSEVGYSRTFWDTEVVKVYIKCIDRKLETKIETIKNGKVVDKISRHLTLEGYLSLWEYIDNGGIQFLKNALWLNGSLTDDEFRALYKKIPRMYSYICDFYFICGSNRYSYGVDDIGYIKDPRYLETLKRINKLIGIKTEINVFGDDSRQ